ncbi:T9SS type A sorting domain-containing protein [Longitalea luteola]|uniref:T9SS type A sorting domain-containing protein n=1 Tax=Longitalea luteola TaxID=2812563 RepID=UPI001A964627|nr:T9SS type A sorting domain-containing protein [Longitalea luteola]
MYCLDKMVWKLRHALVLLVGVLAGSFATAQAPQCKIDCNMSGRPPAEVLEPGYFPWTFASGVKDTASLSLSDGVTITLIRRGPYGVQLRPTWNKANVQAPYLSRLINDGFTVDGAQAGAQIEMRISGLPAGRHSILTYHNHVDNPATNSFAPIDIYLNGQQKYNNLPQTVREIVPSKATIAYVYADVTAGQDVVMLFAGDTASGGNNKTFLINGIEINTANPQYQARQPMPENTDEHVNADEGTLTLNWMNAPNAVASHIYYGTDSAAVATATVNSPQYKGRRITTTYIARNQDSKDTYWWRVDQEDSSGNITHGNSWYYRTRHLAFSDAEGYGRFARGGRHGKVVHVTNLNDSGPGSLREAVTNDIGPRTIVFDVSGLITLNSRLTVNQHYITIAGQTAPGKGICIKGAPFGTTGNDLIVRHIRIRVGGPVTSDGTGVLGNHSIMDNCSVSWTIDEAFSSRNAKNITLQRTMLAEALNVAGHKNYPPGTAHGYAATISGNNGSFHHNLLAHCAGRNWSLGGALDGNAYYTGRLDIRNNVVYNWDNRTTDGGAHQVNFVNNYYKPGAASRHLLALSMDHEGVGSGTQQAYFAGNVMPGRFDENSQTLGRRTTIRNGAVINYETFVDTPFFPSYVNTQTAYNAYKNVLSNVGANQPMIDSHDIRIIHETLTGTYTYSGSVSGKPGLPDKETDVGGWESYPETHRAPDWDTDGDGLPDWWEELKHLDTRSSAGDFSDANNDRDKDGFTQLEDYLEFMGGPHYFAQPFKPMMIDLTALTRGYTNSPVYTINKVVKGITIQWRCVNGKLFYLPFGKGFSSITFTVSDAEGHSMTRTIRIASRYEKITVRQETEKEETVESPSKIMVWPVPSKGQFNISLKGLQQPVVVRMYRIDGTMVGSEVKMQGGSVRSFNITTRGNYIVTGTDAITGEPVFTKKLMIE